MKPNIRTSGATPYLCSEANDLSTQVEITDCGELSGEEAQALFTDERARTLEAQAAAAAVAQPPQ